MGKRILIRESQLKRIIESIKEDDTQKAIGQLNTMDKVSNTKSKTPTSDSKVDPNSMKAYLDAFGKFIEKTGVCSLNEAQLKEGNLLDELKSVFKKGVLIASAAIALGILTPQEAQAQVGSAGQPEIIKLFKKKGRDACDPNRGQGKLATDKQKPTSSVIVYKAPYLAPKFGHTDGLDKYYVMNKAGDYKEVSAKEVQKIKKKHGISTKVIKGKELKKAIQQNR